MLATFGDRVVEGNSAGTVVPAVANTIKGLTLCLGTFGIVVLLMPKVVRIEKLEPSLRPWLGVVDKFEKSCNSTSRMARDLTHHEGCVANGTVPEFSRLVFW